MRPIGAKSCTVLLISVLFSFSFAQGEQSAAQGEQSAAPLLTATKTTLTSSLNPSTFGQTVTFTAKVTPTTGNGTVTGTVTFSDTKMGVTSVIGTQNLVGGVATQPTSKLNAGSNTITAMYNGSSSFGTSSATLTQTVNKASTKTVLTSAPNPSMFNQSVTFTATITPAADAGTVTFTFGAKTLCTVTVSGGTAPCPYAALPVGSDTVTAAYGGSGNYLASSGSETQTVTKATPIITWPTPAAITYPTPLSSTQLDATANVPGTFVYTPPSGTVLTAGTHTLSVTFTPTDTTDYNTASDSVMIVVNKGTPIITWPTPAAITYPTPLGSAQLDATANVPGTFVYTPPSGTVLTAGTHTLSVTFTPTDTTDYNTASDSVMIVVNKGTPIITWPTPAAITYPTPLGSTQLDATANVPGTFVYTPPSGTILTAGTHTLSVTFTPTDTTDYNTATDSVMIVVNKGTPIITWPTPAAITYPTPLSSTQLDATANVPGTFVYTPPSGTVLTAGTQTLSTTFTPTDTTDYNTATATVQIVVNKGTPIITWPTPPAITYPTPLGSAQLDASANVPGTFVYTPPSGTVLTAGTQTLSTTFTPTDTTDYNTASDSVMIVVNKGTPIITWPTPPAITYPTPLGSAQLDASANVPGTFVYTPPSGTVLTAGTQTLSVTFTPTDTTDYNTATDSVMIVVNKGTPIITWPTPAPISYGTALSSTQLDATANVPGTFVYTPPSGTVLTAGTQTLSTTFTPTDTTDYNTATDSVQLVVNQVTPILTWLTPAPITAQATLSSTQLDASANVPGTFAYSPQVGTMLPAGLQTLSVTFTPTDTTDYTTASDSVQIEVYPANTLIVATNGKDTWSGYYSVPNPPANPTDGPLASPAGAQTKVRAIISNKPTTPIAVYLRAGTYYLALTQSPSTPGTLVFNTSDSGTATAPVTWQPYPGDATPIISGGVPVTTDPTAGVGPQAGLDLTWNVKDTNWYYANLPATLPGTTIPIEPFETLYYNGERRLRARVHDTGFSNGVPTLSVGYYMNGSTCTPIPGWPAGEFPGELQPCNLGSFLRVAGVISPGNGVTCPYTTASDGTEKCLDRFIYTQSTGTGNDVIDNWTNLTSTTAVPNQPCQASTNYPPGDVELTLFDAWTVDVMRINCVDTTNHIIYLTGPTKNGGSTNNYNFFGPSVNHRFIIENSHEAFTAAQADGQVGIWFLDRSQNGNWVLNYIANQSVTPAENPMNDNVVIPQLPQTGTTQFLTGGQFPLFGANGKALNDYIGGSLIWATNLSYVTFTGIDFEVDNFYPAYANAANIYTGGFNNDVNGEMPVPQAIDCENCQFVSFSGDTVRHTSATGILAGATASTPACSTGAPPTLTSYCVLIDNSSFYDIGDSGIRVGHYPSSNDASANIAQDVLIQNNLVQGFSRVLADGEGITTANGYYNDILNNTVTDGYHAGISICFNGCGHTANNGNVDSDYILVNNNLVSNLMQGITSDGGSIYFNVGSNYSAVGDKALGNVVYDTTDSYIIDLGNGITKNDGTGYGGEGIYLDAQTADVDVENNLVFNVDGHAIHLTEGLASSTETYNTFKNNIFAFANEAMFTQGSPWPNGCPQTQIQEVQVLDNLLVFDIDIDTKETGRSVFSVIQGCTDSCITSTGAASYSDYQLFQGNDYWSSKQNFGSVSDAFKIQADQSQNGLTLNGTTYSCSGASPVSLTFSEWQTGNTPVPMMEDAGGATASPQANNSMFPLTGSSQNVKEDFTIANASGLGQFNPNGSDGKSGTNGAITGAGSTLPAPPTVCTTVQTTPVCPTFPTYVYGGPTLPF